ncbi:uncharacterized protein LOC110390475 isoform X4 [Numida meleagris]|uniref:uncharacterized protein LOC110390475 isoform X4 n=1 Tax=Numida meleagris TaxID=8996 RepID=UPI000B3DEA61|nr:uncharacterized protein LOC110390475 isoform X4 [Numida meleagris]
MVFWSSLCDLYGPSMGPLYDPLYGLLVLPVGPPLFKVVLPMVFLRRLYGFYGLLPMAPLYDPLCSLWVFSVGLSMVLSVGSLCGRLYGFYGSSLGVLHGLFLEGLYGFCGVLPMAPLYGPCGSSLWSFSGDSMVSMGSSPWLLSMIPYAPYGSSLWASLWSFLWDVSMILSMVSMGPPCGSSTGSFSRDSMVSMGSSPWVLPMIFLWGLCRFCGLLSMVSVGLFLWVLSLAFLWGLSSLWVSLWFLWLLSMVSVCAAPCGSSLWLLWVLFMALLWGLYGFYWVLPVAPLYGPCASSLWPFSGDSMVSIGSSMWLLSLTFLWGLYGFYGILSMASMGPPYGSFLAFLCGLYGFHGGPPCGSSL